MRDSSQKTVVLGAGGWGVALSCVLASNSQSVTIWEFDPRVAENLQKSRTLGKKLPGVTLPEGVCVTDNLVEALENADFVVLVTPSQYVRSTCKAIAVSGIKSNAIWVSGSKGIERKTLYRMSEVVAECLPLVTPEKFVVLSGPSHAEEVARRMPTTLTAVSESVEAALRVCDLFSSPALRIYTGDDIIGVETGASLKNVIAVAAGISDGLGFGDNAKAALVTRGLAEITRLGVAMGARAYTFAGLTGLGDLVVTCCSRLSRNWQLGNRLAQGQSASEAMEEMGMVAEGYYTADSVAALCARFNIEMPISREVYRILYEGKPPKEAVQDLMLRGVKHETEKDLYK